MPPRGKYTIRTDSGKEQGPFSSIKLAKQCAKVLVTEGARYVDVYHHPAPHEEWLMGMMKPDGWSPI